MDVISVVLTHHSSWPCCLLLLPRRHGAGSTPTPHNFLVTSHQSPHRIPSIREQLLRRGQHATRVLTGGVWSRRKALLALEPPGASLSPCPAGPTQLHLERRWGNSSASLPVRGSVLPRSLYIIIIAFAIDQHCVLTGQSNQSNLNLFQQYSSLPSNIDYMR